MYDIVFTDLMTLVVDHNRGGGCCVLVTTSDLTKTVSVSGLAIPRQNEGSCQVSGTRDCVLNLQLHITADA